MVFALFFRQKQIGFCSGEAWDCLIQSGVSESPLLTAQVFLCYEIDVAFLRRLDGRSDGIGRRAGLKIPCPFGRVGSTPTSGIYFRTKINNFYKQRLPVRIFVLKHEIMEFVLLNLESVFDAERGWKCDFESSHKVGIFWIEDQDLMEQWLQKTLIQEKPKDQMISGK